MNQLIESIEPATSTFPRELSRKAAAARRILVADDDVVVRKSLADVFASEGYVVDEAQNGLEAVKCAIVHAPDLILLDLNMPQWDGWTAFSQLDRVTPLVPVIVITARPNQYEKAVRLGVDAFMEKPLDFPILLKATARLLRESPQAHLKRITDRKFVTRLLRTPVKELHQ
jgi:CheY-like chemotaxis protein